MLPYSSRSYPCLHKICCSTLLSFIIIRQTKSFPSRCFRIPFHSLVRFLKAFVFCLVKCYSIFHVFRSHHLLNNRVNSEVDQQTLCRSRCWSTLLPFRRILSTPLLLPLPPLLLPLPPLALECPHLLLLARLTSRIIQWYRK